MRLLFFFFLTYSSFTWGQSFTLTDNQTGRQYLCSPMNGQNPIPPPNPQKCVDTITQICREKTSYGGNQCYNQATNLCKNKSITYPECVAASVKTCTDNTSYGGNYCFDQAVRNCE
jgi:hypothetical protein